MATFWHPATGLQLSVVHTLLSLQLSAVPAVHKPAWQVSLPLHTLPSRQRVPFSTGVFWHPVAGLQLSVVHTLLSLQLSAVPAVHVPLWHVSSPLQTLLSAHELPLGNAGFPQTPSVHTSLVQGFPSAQSAFTPHVWQPGMGVFWQPLTGWHVSVVQALASLQLSGAPAEQVPLWQVSAPLQTSLSAHGVPLVTGVFWQPRAGSQVSVVHTLLSLQLSGVPVVQVPVWQVSAPLQTLLSAHEVPLVTGVF